MDRQKLLLVALVAVAVLFLVALAAGASRPGTPGGSSKDPVDWLEGLRSERFLTVGRGGTGSGCGSGDRLTLGAPCVVRVPERGFLSRPTQVALDLVSGAVAIEVRPDRGAALTGRLPGEDGERCFESALGAGGGELVLAPLGGDATIDVRDDHCPEG